MTNIYKCNRCNKIYNHKNDFKKHMNRKTPCQNIIIIPIIPDEFKCSHCNKTYTRKDNLNRHISHFCKLKKINTFISPKNPDISNDNNLLQIDNIIINDNIIDKGENLNLSFLSPNENVNTHNEKSKHQITSCQHCFINFSRKSSLDRHLNGRCKILNKKDEDQIIIKKLLEEMNQKMKNIEIKNQQLENENKDLKNKFLDIENNKQNINIDSNIIKNNNNNNNILNNNTQIHNNINIVAFGKEDLDQLVSDSVCKKILFKGFEAVPQLIEYIHFNEKKPEYHNCYISNLRDKYAIVFDGSNWQVKDIALVIETLRDNKRDFLERKFEDFYDSLDEQTKIKFKRFLNEADTDIVINRYKESLKKLLYNKKQMVINRRKQQENEIKSNNLLK